MNDLHNTPQLSEAPKHNLPTVFMFSGQGSQYYAMGKNLYDYHAGFQQKMRRLDGLFAALIGESIVEKIYDQKKDRSAVFDEILFTHPAIFMIEYSLGQILLEEGIRPDYILGTSLGEISAAALAEVIPIDECVRFVAQQAQLFNLQCSPATMIAIMAGPDLYQRIQTLKESSEIASINSADHFVVSVHAKNVNKVTDSLRDKEILYQSLPVKQGFHSSLIDSVANEYQQLAASITFQQPIYPIVSAVDGKQKESIDQEHLWDVVRKPIEFLKSIQFLESLGPFNYVDVGPMGTLATLGKQTITEFSGSRTHSILTQFALDIKNLSEVIVILTTEYPMEKNRIETEKNGIEKE